MLKFIREIYWQISGGWYAVKTSTCWDCGCTQNNIEKQGDSWQSECVCCGRPSGAYNNLYIALREEGWFSQEWNKFLKLIKAS